MRIAHCDVIGSSLFSCFAVWDVHFHPTYPNNLFSCSQDGSLWHWDATTSTASATMAAPSSSLTHQSPSLNKSHQASYPSTTATSALSTNTLLSQGPSLLPRTPLFTSNPTTSQQCSATTSNGPLLTGAQSMATAGRSAEGAQQGGFSGAVTSPWLSGAIQQGKVEIVNLIPDNRISVNSLDIESRHLVCGTDGEALFVIPNLTLTWSSFLCIITVNSESLLSVVINHLLLLWILLIHVLLILHYYFIYVPGVIYTLIPTYMTVLRKNVFLVFCLVCVTVLLEWNQNSIIS